MKKNKLKKRRMTLILLAAAALTATGCRGADNRETQSSSAAAPASMDTEARQEGEADQTAQTGTALAATSLEVRFGDEGAPFIMQLEDNPTAAAIAGHVGTASWRLPIYHYDDYENWEVMQYYDIPSRYEIPSGAQTVTAELAGEVYYSEPNRIILFYQDGEVSGEYTKIGTIENTEEFRAAVAHNPVLEGWGNKIVLIDSVR